MEWFTGKSGPEAEGYTKMPDDKATPAAADPPPVKPTLSRQETVSVIGSRQRGAEEAGETRDDEQGGCRVGASTIAAHRRTLGQNPLGQRERPSVSIAYSLDSTQIASAVGDKIILQFTVDNAHISDKNAVGSSTVDKSATKDQGSSLVKPDDGEMEIEVDDEVNTLSFGPPVDTGPNATNVHDRAAGTIAAAMTAIGGFTTHKPARWSPNVQQKCRG